MKHVYAQYTYTQKYILVIMVGLQGPVQPCPDEIWKTSKKFINVTQRRCESVEAVLGVKKKKGILSPKKRHNTTCPGTKAWFGRVKQGLDFPGLMTLDRYQHLLQWYKDANRAIMASPPQVCDTKDGHFLKSVQEMVRAWPQTHTALQQADESFF